MHGNRIFYTAVGDSLTVGTGAIFSPGFVKRYAELLEQRTGKTVLTAAYAQNGLTSGQVVQLLTLPDVRKSVAEANVVTITVGGNDLIQAARRFEDTGNIRVFEQAYMSFRANVDILIRTILNMKARSFKPFIVRIVDFYNPLSFSPGVNGWIRRFNAYLHSYSYRFPAVKTTHIYEAFLASKTNLFSLDDIHPNGKGYAVITAELDRLGYDGLLYKVHSF